MDTLLNQLKKLDLELHQEIIADLLPPGDHRNNFIICGKLQEAIRARGWRYGLDYDTDRVSATILENIGYTWKLIGVGYGFTEAEALLRAYLAAI